MDVKKAKQGDQEVEFFFLISAQAKMVKSKTVLLEASSILNPIYDFSASWYVNQHSLSTPALESPTMCFWFPSLWMYWDFEHN